MRKCKKCKRMLQETCFSRLSAETGLVEGDFSICNNCILPTKK